MKLLAIDTSTEACSAALMFDDEILEQYEVAPRKHAGLILAMIDKLLIESGNRLNDLDALAFGRGPGAFTGVRIATGVIQGLGFGTDLPVIPVSSLAALAQGLTGQHEKIASAIDARMGEVYWGLFKCDESNIVISAGAETVTKPEQIIINEDGGDWCGVGSGWDTYHERLMNHLQGKVTAFIGERFPRAGNVARIAGREYRLDRMLPAEKALPVYLRNEVTG